VVAPKLLSNADVRYPEGAKGDATVVLTLTINKEGQVSQAVPAETNEPFSSQAVGVALGWRFEPATRGGAPIAAKIKVEVVFREPLVMNEPDIPEEYAPKTPPEPANAKAPAPKAGEPIEVIIRGVRPEASRTVTLSRSEVRQIPGVFGDPFRAVEIMPGVTPIISGLPFFFVRGAPPGDVGYFLDGIRVPLLFHVGVGPSVIHPALIERVDLYPGGYPARYGRYSGGIVAGETVAPMDRIHGEYNVRLYDAGALAEAPFADGRATVLLGGRYSYTAALLSLLQSTAVLDYWDYQARATYDFDGKNKIGLFAFGSYDYLGEQTSDQTLTLFGAEFHRLDLRFDHRFGPDGEIRIATTGGIDRTRLPDDRFLRDRLIGARTELEYKLASGALLRAGTDLQLDSYDIELGTSNLSVASQAGAALFPTRTDVGIAGRADVVFTPTRRVEITPGARLDFYQSESATALALDPRLSVRLEMTPSSHFLSAIGIASQAPSFVVPLPGFQPGGLKGGLQRALQQSFGVEVDLGQNTIATATVYHNGFFNMSDPLGSSQATLGGCPPGSFPDQTLPGDRGNQPQNPRGGCRSPDTISQDTGHVLQDATGGQGNGSGGGGTASAVAALEKRTMGRAYGFELFVKRKLTSRLGGFLSYTLSRSTRTLGNQEFIAAFDRTHVANAALAYDLGRNWRAGTRVVFYTGLPKAPDPTDPGSTRLAPFFRLDLRLEKRWILSEHVWISAVAEWMNATLSKEEISTTCTLQGCQTNTVGPVTIPSLGVEGGF
jgi:TonB family protein